MKNRIEQDSLGQVEVPADYNTPLYRAIASFNSKLS